MRTIEAAATVSRDRKLHMPIVARFYGILIKMYFKEHGRPDFHALYGEFNGLFDIETLEVIEGDLPARAERLVREWGEN